jgi:hypothetical protein
MRAVIIAKSFLLMNVSGVTTYMLGRCSMVFLTAKVF